MTKISNQYSLTNILTADLANSRLGINNVSPTVALDVTGAGKFSGVVTLNSNEPLILNRANNTSTSNAIRFQTGGTTQWYVGSDYYLQSGTENFGFYNGSYKLTITAAGNVGIGTSSPASLLSIQRGATGDNMEFIGSGASGYSDILFYNTNKVTRLGYIDWSDTQVRWNVEANIPLLFYTNSSERMRITSTGNVGIGTSSPAASTGTTKTLQIGSSTIIQSVVGDQTTLADNAYYNGTTAWQYINARKAAAMRFGANADGDITFHTAGTGSAGGTISNWDSTGIKMTIKNGGYIDLNNVVYNDTASGSPRNLFIASGGTIGGISSIRASKKNIQNVSNIDWLYQLNPVTFNYRKKDENRNYTEEIYDELTYGLIAEDTQPIAEFLINYDDSNSNKEMIGIEYMKLITPMLKAIQELSAKVSLLENK